MMRSLLFEGSARTATPADGTTAMPAALLKLAIGPTPSVAPIVPLPASVVTLPAGVTMRILLPKGAVPAAPQWVIRMAR